MQTGGGRGGGPVVPGIDGLVAAGVLQRRRDVGRQRCFAEIVQIRLDRFGKFDDALVFVMFFDHGGFDRLVGPLTDGQPGSDFDTLAADDHQPAGLIDRAQQQNFRRAAGGDFLRGQARRDHARLVQNQHVAGIEISGQIAEAAVLDLPGSAVHHQHSRGVARLDGCLGDTFGRQMIVKV